MSSAEEISRFAQGGDDNPSGLVQDQPQPRPSGRPAIWDLVIADMRARDDVGRERYGTPLQAFNGRDAMVDLYQELLDAAVYARQVLAERSESTKVLDSAVAEDYRAEFLGLVDFGGPADSIDMMTFARGVAFLIREEIEKLSPDNATLAILCDAARIGNRLLSAAEKGR